MSRFLKLKCVLCSPQTIVQDIHIQQSLAVSCQQLHFSMTVIRDLLRCLLEHRGQVCSCLLGRCISSLVASGTPLLVRRFSIQERPVLMSFHLAELQLVSWGCKQQEVRVGLEATPFHPKSRQSCHKPIADAQSLWRTKS